MFALDEIVDHRHRTRTIERIECCQVFDRVWLVTPQHIAHTMRFKLKNSGRQSTMEHSLICFLVLQWDLIERELLASLRDQFQRVVEDGQRRQSEKIHL